MTLNQDIFAVKLYEMEKQYGRLQSRLRICGRENREKLQAELEHAKEEYEENSLLLKQSIQGSRSPAVAELAQVQWEYMHKVEDLLKEKAEQFFHCEATSKEEDLAEAASLYAEYAMDFATQAMQYALIVALTAMDLQRNAEGCSRCRRRCRRAGLLETEETQRPPRGRKRGTASPAPGRAGGGSPRRGGPW